VDYRDSPPWPEAADGAGHSIHLIRPSLGENAPEAWAESDSVGGSPGRADPLSNDPLASVFINEWQNHSDPEDWIELYNHSTNTVNMSGAWLSDDPLTNKFRIPNGTFIPPHGFLVYSQSQLGFELFAGGETILLWNSNVTRVIDIIDFRGASNNVSQGRWPNGGPFVYGMGANTPGSPNSVPRRYAVVINEIMYNPISGSTDEEYLEIYNRGSAAVNLAGWEFVAGITYVFPTNSSTANMPPGAHWVVARNPANLFSIYPNLNTNNTFGPYGGTLANGGERVVLAAADYDLVTRSNITTTERLNVVVSDVTYGDGGKWGNWSDGQGSSLELIDPEASRGKHCSSPVATGKYFIAPECDFTDLESGERTRARMFKSACRLPFIPANGLLYTFPVQCECFPMLRGYMGMSSTPLPNAEAPDFERVGPAKQPKGASPGDEWPMYRRDVFRSGVTPQKLRRETPKQKWAVKLAPKVPARAADDWSDDPFIHGDVTAPVVADGKVFAAISDTHRVVALDAASGKLRWDFVAGGRVDLPPTIHEGLCLFGAHDGWVYCLNADDGSLVWRRRVAPQESRIAAYGQLESAWPATGSVLVDNGVGYIPAGRHPMCDGGVQVLAFKPRTGELVWQKNINDLTTVITNWYGPTIAPKVKVGLDFEPVDILVKDSNAVAMSRWRFNPANGDWQLAMGSTNYTAGAQSVPRGAWGYGIRQTKLVLPRVPLAFDDERVYRGSTNASALVIAGKTLISASERELQIGETKVPLRSPIIHDGLSVAYGRLYASTEDGELVCFE
jgi:hypothetical protein